MQAFSNKDVNEKVNVFNKAILNILSNFRQHERIVINDGGDLITISVGIYLLKVNIRNTRTRCETCSKLMASFWCL